MEIRIEYGEETAVFIEYIECLHVLVIDRDVGILLESDAIEAGGQAEYAFLDVLQFKIGAKHFVVEVELAVLELLRVVSPVPRHQCEIGSLLFAGQCLYFGIFLLCSWFVGFEQLIEQVVDVGAVLCHAALQLVGGIIFVSQQLGKCQAGVDQLLHDVEVIAGVGVRTLGVIGHVDFLAQVSVGGIGQERYIAWGVQGEDPAFLLFLAGRFGGSVDGTLRQTFQLGFVGQYQLVVVGFL